RQSPVQDEEQLDAAAQVGETAALALRLRQEGLDFDRFRRRFGLDPRTRWGGPFAELSGLGLLDVDSRRATLTDAGLLVSNEIATRFL
ncbi:MAG: radical SAM family heme chaperone HemW, partial [Chloroflexota bacterium]